MMFPPCRHHTYASPALNLSNMVPSCHDVYPLTNSYSGMGSSSINACDNLAHAGTLDDSRVFAAGGGTTGMGTPFWQVGCDTPDGTAGGPDCIAKVRAGEGRQHVPPPVRATP